jgi:hypothetical protein
MVIDSPVAFILAGFRFWDKRIPQADNATLRFFLKLATSRASSALTPQAVSA